MVFGFRNCNTTQIVFYWEIPTPSLINRSMHYSDFIVDPKITALLQELRKEGRDSQEYSDIIDEQGHQYVDLVLEGGGVLGVALVGYTWMLEQMGLRFASVAGTSAGAINAMLLAAHSDTNNKGQLSSEWVLDKIANTRFELFLDGPKHARKIVAKVLSGNGLLSIGFSALRIKKYLKQHLGMHPGLAFEQWLGAALAEMDIHKMADLTKSLAQKTQRLQSRSMHADTSTGTGTSIEITAVKIAVICAELSTQSKIELPKMASLFWEKPETVSPAKHVRASMSIPAFFHPMKVPIEGWRPEIWSDFTGFRGKAFKEATLVDGGIVSNFPIHVFHKKGIPRRPTFGVKLNNSRAAAQTVNTLGQKVGMSFSTARHLFDYDFLYKNPDYRQLIGFIDTGEHHWLNFSLSSVEKKDLFYRGAQAAATFLRRFDWGKYRSLRLAQV